ncbi:hypothetical protein KBD45_03560 [Candidatus Dojkabacteria bacterium]|nr:hypothetical protein [Candidatus Dojkabacteria bacterium]
METTTSSLFTKLKDPNQVNLPQVMLVTFVIAISVGAFVFAAKLRMNSDVAPENSSAHTIVNLPISDGNPTAPKKCKTNLDCYPNNNTCVKNTCKTEEYPLNAPRYPNDAGYPQKLTLGGTNALMFKQLIISPNATNPKNRYNFRSYKYTFLQNNIILHTSPFLTTGEYAIYPSNKDYAKFKPGELTVRVYGFYDTHLTNPNDPYPLYTYSREFKVTLVSQTTVTPKPTPVPICLEVGSECAKIANVKCCKGLVCTKVSGSGSYSCQKTPTPMVTRVITKVPTNYNY